MTESIFERLIDFFDRQNPVANFLAIATAGIAIFAGARNYVLERNRPRRSVETWIVHTLASAGDRLNKPAVTSAQIAIVDDVPTDFPVDYMKSLGYQITVFRELSLAGVDNLQPYDLVVLDIAGVVREDLERGGLQLIQKIKQLPNAPIVVAVSGKTYDPTVTEFFRLAESQLKKPVAPVEFEERINELLGKSLSPRALATRIDLLLSQTVQNPTTRLSLTHKVINMLRANTYDAGFASTMPPPAKAQLAFLIRKLVQINRFYAPD